MSAIVINPDGYCAAALLPSVIYLSSPRLSCIGMRGHQAQSGRTSMQEWTSGR
jgi:hypothetical protein